MKATLHFNLEDPDDKFAFNRCHKANDMAMALWDYSQELRAICKYSDDEVQQKHWGEAREKFYEVLKDYGIDLDDLTR